LLTSSKERTVEDLSFRKQGIAMKSRLTPAFICSAVLAIGGCS